MRITKMSKTLGRVINTGNFCNVKLEAYVEADINEGDSLELASKLLYDEATRMLKDDLARIKKAREEKDVAE